jgi:hypothetical protein
MFALKFIGSYGDILGQNYKILLKNRQILEKMYNHFIFTCVLNLCDSSYDKCYRLSFFMSQKWFVCYFGHFGAKTTEFFKKICESVSGQ